MAGQSIRDDFDMLINGYAVFMGYLMMGVRGLGILIITWATVVLLGGFVSVLGKKDFWCLTGITLVQTAGVFNFLLKEKREDFVRGWWGLLGAGVATAKQACLKRKGDIGDVSCSRLVLALMLALFLVVIQTLVLVIILGPIVVLYIFGMYISAGAGLWRLIEHDFGNADGGANLEPALEVLYGLAVAQGVLFGYKKIHAGGAKAGLAEYVTEQIGLVNKELVSEELVSAYLEETVAGCEKDPSLATDRNLVTYAVDLMVEAKSNDGFIAGVQFLGAVIRGDRRVQAKHLLTRSASLSHMIQRLLETLGPRSPYSREVRENAAWIVALVAGGIRLEQFPAVIESISSLFDTFEEYSWVPEDYQRPSHLPKEYERDWLLEEEERRWLIKSTDSNVDITSPESDRNLRDYTRLVVQGLIILRKLAVREDNCKVIINTEGLLLKITGYVISDQLHRDHHAEWSSIAEESLELMIRLMAAPGETGTKLRSDIISGNSKAIISTLGSILECCNCTLRRKEQAVRTLLDLSVDPSSIIGCVVPLTWILLYIFLVPEHSLGYIYGSAIHRQKKSSCIRRLAGEKLSAMLPLQSEGSATSRLQSVRVVLRDLSRALVHVGNISNRLHALDCLKDLWMHTKDDEYLEEVRKTMVDVMSKVLKEILGWTRDATQPVTEANDVLFSVQDIDLESAGVSQGNGEENTSSSQQLKREQDEYMKLREALIDFCHQIRWMRRWSEDDKGLTRQLDEIAEKICLEQGKPAKNFEDLVVDAKKNYGIGKGNN